MRSPPNMLRLCRPQISPKAVDAVVRVLQSGNLVQGIEVQSFEAELAEYLGCEQTILVSSGTAALHLALMAIDIRPGDAVLVPDFTFPATGNVVSQLGARVVLVDVDPNTYTLDLLALERQLRSWSGPERLRAVMPVHEFGAPVAMDRLMTLAERFKLKVVEDAACALGARYQGRRLGTWGELGCFSFHPRKTLTTAEGGLLSTNNSALADRLRALRSHGMVRSDGQVRFNQIGLNYRLTDLQAALGRHQLPNLDKWIARRRELAELYRSKLADLAEKGHLRLPLDLLGHSYQTFMIVLASRYQRSEVIQRLAGMGIEANLGAQSLSELGLYGTQPTHLISSELYRHGVAIPLHESLRDEDALQIVAALKKILAES